MSKVKYIRKFPTRMRNQVREELHYCDECGSKYWHDYNKARNRLSVHKNRLNIDGNVSYYEVYIEDLNDNNDIKKRIKIY